MEAVRDDSVMAEINITPFTDVLLVLLIIFMILAALVAPPGFEKTLRDPSSIPPTHRTAPHTIEVVVNERDTIFVDGKPSSAHALYTDLQASYATIIRVLDAAKVAGLEDVGFVTSS